MLGVIDLGSEDVETPAIVAQRIERALPHIAAGKIIVAPDCGMKYLPRDIAYRKLVAMVEGTKQVRAKLGG